MVCGRGTSTLHPSLKRMTHTELMEFPDSSGPPLGLGTHESYIIPMRQVSAIPPFPSQGRGPPGRNGLEKQKGKTAVLKTKREKKTKREDRRERTPATMVDGTSLVHKCGASSSAAAQPQFLMCLHRARCNCNVLSIFRRSRSAITTIHPTPSVRLM